jgi:hypothetical protein
MPRASQSRNFGLDPRVGDGDAAQAGRKPRQRVKYNTIVIDMRVALHDEGISKAEMVKERDEALNRRIGRGVAAAGLIGKFVRRSEDMRMRVPGAGRRLDARAARMRNRPGNARRVVGDVHLNFPRSVTSPWRGEVASQRVRPEVAGPMTSSASGRG